MLYAAGMVKLKRIDNFLNERSLGEKIPEDWENSYAMPIYRMMPWSVVSTEV